VPIIRWFNLADIERDKEGERDRKRRGIARISSHLDALMAVVVGPCDCDSSGTGQSHHTPREMLTAESKNVSNRKADSPVTDSKPELHRGDFQLRASRQRAQE